jgi:hypothetical protein
MVQVPLSYAQEFTAQVNVLDAAAKELLAQRLAAVDFASETALADCVAAMKDVCGAATQNASVLASTFYDRVRALYADDGFTALAESHLSAGALEGTVRKEVAKGADGIEGRMRRVLGAEIVREKHATIYANGRRDPLKPAYARVPVPSGSIYGWKKGETHNAYLAEHGTCAFCEMLASRGFAYRSEGTADAHVHDGCNCVVMPGFDGVKTKVGGYDPEVYMRGYEKYQSQDHMQSIENHKGKRKKRYDEEGRLKAGY